jgi:hypothetical protein
MTQPGFHVDKPALRQYTADAGHTAGAVAEVGTQAGRTTGAMPGDLFGEVGREAGLPGAFGTLFSAVVAEVGQISNAVSQLGGAVSGALQDYERQDAEHAAGYRRIQH